MPPIPTMGPSFRSLPCWLLRRRLNTSSLAAASGRGCPRPSARAPQRMTMAAAGLPRRLPRYRHAVGRTSYFGCIRMYRSTESRLLRRASARPLPRARSAGCSVRAILGPVGDSEVPRSGLRSSAQRRHRCRAGAAHARRLEGSADPRAHISGGLRGLALGCQRGDERDRQRSSTVCIRALRSTFAFDEPAETTTARGQL